MKISLSKQFYILPFLIGLFTGLYFISLNILGYSFDQLPGNLGDGRLNLYFLEHAYQYLIGNVESYWDAPFMYPTQNVISYSDNLLGSAPFYFIFRFLNLDIFTSFQSWYLCLVILNYSTSYIFLKKLTKNNYAAVIGAMVFTFSLALQSQLTHAQTFPRFAIPLVFLMAINFKKEFNPKYFFFCLLLIVYQIYCAIYLGFMLIIPVGIFFLITFILNYDSLKFYLKRKKWNIKMLSSIVISSLLLIPLMLPYLERKKGPSLSYFFEIIHTIPTVESHFFIKHGTLLWEVFSNTARDYIAFWDHQLYAGGIATLSLFIFFIFIIYKRFILNGEHAIGNNNTFFQLLITALISKFLYIRIGILSAYFIVFLIPGFAAMRSITRIINIELIFFAVATAYIFSYLLKKKNWSSFLLFLFSVSIVTVDNYVYKGRSHTIDKTMAQERIGFLIKIMDGFPKGSFVSYEPNNVESSSVDYHLDAMLAAQHTNQIVVNGYTATCPIPFEPFWLNIDEASRTHWLQSTNARFDSLFVIKSSSEYEVVHREEIF